MSAYSTLERTLRDILHVLDPSREDWSARFQIIDELRAVVQSVESLRGATVEPYGSFVSNLFSRWGDLDISIELLNGSYISTPGKKHKQTLLRDVLKALRRRGGWRKLQLVPHARVPILKFESSYQNISCDISINNLNGQMKSKLLFWINGIDGRFRNMVLLVKEWAKAHGINDSKSGTLNSYSLSLLIIFHFQTCVPALLPPLKEIYPGNMVDDLTGVRVAAERRIEEICAQNITRFKSDKSRTRNRISLPELFISFLEKFSDISSRALNEGICLYTGQWEDIDSNMRWLPKNYALFVEDPFEQPANSARTVSHRNLVRISEAFQTTHHMLISGNLNQSFLIENLVRPQLLQYISRTPNNPSGYGIGYSRARPQMHRAVHSPTPLAHPQMHRAVRSPTPLAVPQMHRAEHTPTPPAQHQIPNTRVDRRPNGNNGTMNRSVNASHSQSQLFWRPRSDR